MRQPGRHTRSITPHTMRTEDGVRLSACHRQPATGEKDLGLVLAHGFSGSCWRTRQTRIASLLARSAGVISFDFRGHGRSGGRSTVGDREIWDVHAAVRLARLLGYQRVATAGFSMGAAVVIRHAGLLGGVDALAAISGPGRWHFKGTAPMRRLHWVVEQPCGRLLGRLALGARISSRRWGTGDAAPTPPAAAIARLARTPVLVVHGDRDPYFPAGHAHALFDAARQPKELWIERGYGHAEGAVRPALIARIGRWLQHSVTYSDHS